MKLFSNYKIDFARRHISEGTHENPVLIDITKDAQIEDLKHQLAKKDAELQKSSEVFKEYAGWRQKLEMIESRMKSEVEHWKSQAEKVQRENTTLQKEALKMSHELMERIKQIKTKDESITKL